ncbi:MAG: type II secretion system protein [Verrucomicrobiaceae bacterium]|nr:MAG: type II secretion system protein [Verrucomicrobiaceae bacterium]
MNTSSPSSRSARAFTLLEMTIVIMVLIALMGLGLFTSRKMDEWKLGRQASETLRVVYSAQRMYLADNPTVSVVNLNSTVILPYMPGSPVAMPTVKSMTGANLSLIVNVSPPVINAGSGVTYDPSGSNRDSLWDVGE